MQRRTTEEKESKPGVNYSGFELNNRESCIAAAPINQFQNMTEEIKAEKVRYQCHTCLFIRHEKRMQKLHLQCPMN